MNEEQIEVVKSTWAALDTAREEAARILYEELFAATPSLRPLFPKDLTAQRAKLMRALGTFITNLDRLDQAVPTLEALGERHVAYGVEERHYPKVGAALLVTLERCLGEAWDAEARESWVALYSLISQVMITAARRMRVA